MIFTWLEELGNGVLRLFLNPLFYWTFIFLFFVGYRRIKRERKQFGVKIFDLFSEAKRTWIDAFIIGIFVSFLFIGAGVVFSYGDMLVLSVVMILLSIGFRSTLLSPGYTIGISYIILLFMPLLLEEQTFFSGEFIAESNFVGLTALLGIMLIAEAFFIRRVERQETFPSLRKSPRGIWIGEHHLHKTTSIPLILLVPGGAIESFAPYWPLLPIGENEYGLILFPFLLGFSYHIRSDLAINAAKRLSKQVLLLGIVVFLISTAGYFLNGMSLLALIIGMLGREFISYRLHTRDKKETPFFKPEEEGLRVLGVIPGTPAERLEIRVGELVTKVNGVRINHPDDFYEVLQSTGAYFRLEIVDDNGEARFVQSAFYEDDHYRLGFLFVEEPFRLENKK